MNGKQFYIHLVQTGEYISENCDNELWCKTDTINNACWFGDEASAVKVAVQIAKDKNLNVNFHLEIIEEVAVIITTRLPIGDFDDWFICPRCKNWCNTAYEEQSKYNNTEYICPDCKGDE
jgi:Zn finger protein HypA/HybF involved in hydrogenase expression